MIPTELIKQFAKTHNCIIDRGTRKFEDNEATNYPELKTFFQGLAQDGYTFQTGYHSLTNSKQVRRFEVVELFKLLRESSLKFTSILIGGSYIDDEGAEAMASYIADTDDLQVLNFHYSRVTEEGMRMIINALKINKSIMLIHLRSNDVTPALGEELQDLVSNHNYTIRQMGIVQRTSCPSDPKPSVELEAAIHARIIANAKAWFAIKDIARLIFLGFEDPGSRLHTLPNEICREIVSHCSDILPPSESMRIVTQFFYRPVKTIEEDSVSPPQQTGSMQLPREFPTITLRKLLEMINR